ncbi:hypothetical protein ED312_06570 [Sinomicrobium pectinilyticum]|uniref:Uncharacterized protein n=2 Tax=Sinomicrobium pectinilyticum TaxID=1084421 RepID=A0A3N0EQA4_SINP1|nr:hypothetical protein ED312_06570 [Sinomicrobium pectinilyticum]
MNSTPTIDANAAPLPIYLNGKLDSVYKTPEIILFNYNVLDIDTLETELSTIKNELYNNSMDTDPVNRYHDTIISSKLARMKVIQSDLTTLNKEQDSLYHLYTKDYLQHKRVTFLTFGPKRSRALFDFIYDGSGKRFQVLNNTGFTFGNNTGSIYSELVSGNLGIFRVSLGSMISSSSSEDNETAKEEEAFQRLASYGGNTVLTMEYPLAYIHSRNNQYNLISRFIAKGSADFPEFGTTTDEFAGSASFGIDIYADASLSNNALRFFMNLNINGIFGTDTYQENLGIDNSSFSFGQVTLGLIVAENIKLSFVLGSFSSESSLQNRNVILGGQILH